jgi:hypothetical protein
MFFLREGELCWFWFGIRRRRLIVLVFGYVVVWTKKDDEKKIDDIYSTTTTTTRDDLTGWLAGLAMHNITIVPIKRKLFNLDL